MDAWKKLDTGSEEAVTAVQLSIVKAKQVISFNLHTSPACINRDQQDINWQLLH
jgi:hypothetical protein